MDENDEEEEEEDQEEQGEPSIPEEFMFDAVGVPLEDDMMKVRRNSEYFSRNDFIFLKQKLKRFVCIVVKYLIS